MDYIQMTYGLPERGPFVEYYATRTEDGTIWHYRRTRQMFIHEQNSANLFGLQEWAIDEWHTTHHMANDGDLVLLGITSEDMEAMMDNENAFYDELERGYAQDRI